MKNNNSFYSDEIAIQMLIWLLKEKGIRKVIVSPGTTNLTLVTSMEHDGCFEMYSCPDERSAAYMACGMATESNEPVVLSCTGATASREYLAGLTEAYHQKIPILAVTSTQSIVNEENLSPQYIDRSIVPRDAVMYSTHIQYIQGNTDEWDCIIKMNRALQHLYKNGGGPVHINLTTVFSENFSVTKLREFRNITYYGYEDFLPPIDSKYKKIAISIGSMWKQDDTLAKEIELFCEKYGAVAFVDHSSGYRGSSMMHSTLLAAQEQYDGHLFNADLLIHIGEYSGDYYTYHRLMGCKEVWRINKDGCIRDTFRHITRIFEVSEEFFFRYYNTKKKKRRKNTYYESIETEMKKCKLREDIIPFSNIYIAQQLATKLPAGSVVHFGMSNSLRSWTFFDLQYDIKSYANVGCRGIDGVLSTALGASLTKPDKLFFVFLGDLAFFYDMNVLGNRHVGRNLRILIVNNDGGAEFHLYSHIGMKTMGDKVGNYVAACGHNGSGSSKLISHFAQDLGFEYLCANDKDSFEQATPFFLSENIYDKPIIFEVFTNKSYESKALKIIRNIYKK